MDQVPTTSGVDIRQPSTAVFGVSSADRFKTNELVAADYVPYPEWDALVTYEIGDKVRQGDLFYISITATNLGNDPELTLDVNWEYTEGPLSYTSRPGKSSPFSFSLQSSQNFLTGYFTRLALTEVVFPWAIPTITNRNNRIGIRYNTGTGPTKIGVVDVVTGWYTLTDLASAIQTAVRAKAAPALAAFTLTCNKSTGSFTAKTNTAETFAFIPVDPFVNGAGTNNITKSQPDRIQLFDMMNWAAGTGTTTTTYILATEQVSGMASLLSTKFIDIVCPKLTGYQNTRDGDTGSRPRDVLARVYLQESTGIANTINPAAENPASALGSQPFVTYKEFGFPKQIAWDPEAPMPGTLEFEVYDDQGYPLSTLQSNPTNAIYDDKNMPDWSFTLLASEV